MNLIYLKLFAACPTDAFGENFCQNKGDHIYYAISGLVCKSQDQNKWCLGERVVYAVNFAGPNLTDSRRIYYQDGTKKLSPSDWELIEDHWSYGPIKYNGPVGVPSLDRKLYEMFYVGLGYNAPRHLKENPSRSCSKLHFKTYGDGLYEISIKTGELWWESDGYRTFSFLLNDMYIVREFQQEMYRERSLAIELVTNFRISQDNTMLELQGHPLKKIESADKKLTFEVCFSSCHNVITTKYKVDRNWIMNALSIIKFNVGKSSLSNLMQNE